MSRREFLLLAGAAGGAVVLAACSKPAADQPTAAPTAKPGDTKVEPTAAPPAAEKVKIEFLGEPGGTEWREEEKAKFEGENSNIEWIQVEQAEGVSRLEQLLSLVAAGTPPDCARVESDVYRTFCKDNLLLSLDNYIASDAEMSKPDYWIQPQEKDRCSYEGQWYGIGASGWRRTSLQRRLFEELGSNRRATIRMRLGLGKIPGSRAGIDRGRQRQTPQDSGFDVDRVETLGRLLATWWFHCTLLSIQWGGLGRPGNPTDCARQTGSDGSAKTHRRLTLVHHVRANRRILRPRGHGRGRIPETKKVALYNTGRGPSTGCGKSKAAWHGVLPKMTRPATDMQAHLVTIVKDTKILTSPGS
jgi:hypothetical protein